MCKNYAMRIATPVSDPSVNDLACIRFKHAFPWIWGENKRNNTIPDTREGMNKTSAAKSTIELMVTHFMNPLE